MLDFISHLSTENRPSCLHSRTISTRWAKGNQLAVLGEDALVGLFGEGDVAIAFGEVEDADVEALVRFVYQSFGDGLVFDGLVLGHFDLFHERNVERVGITVQALLNRPQCTLLFFVMGHHNLLIIAFFFETCLPHSGILLVLLGEGDPALDDAVQISDRVLHSAISRYRLYKIKGW